MDSKIEIMDSKTEAMDSKIDEFQASQSDLTEKHNSLKIKVDKVEDGQQKMKSELMDFEGQLNQFKQSALANNVIVAGLANTKFQPEVIISKIYDVFGWTFKRDDLSSFTYLNNKKDKSIRQNIIY